MDIASPNTIPEAADQPHSWLSPKPSKVVRAMRPSAPGIATARTFQKSLIEKCSPTPKRRKITPNSANWLMVSVSPTNPGVNGPIAIPASMYPMIVGRPRRRAINPPQKATTSAIAILINNGISCIFVTSGMKLYECMPPIE